MTRSLTTATGPAQMTHDTRGLARSGNGTAALSTAWVQLLADAPRFGSAWVNWGTAQANEVAGSLI